MKSVEEILICHNEPVAIYANYSGKRGAEGVSDTEPPASESTQEIDVVKASLSASFGGVATLAVDRNVAYACEKILDSSPDLIFNLVESLEGHVRCEFVMPAVFELIGVPYTGNTALCLGNCLNKSIAKRILRGSGITTPRFEVADCGAPFDLEDIDLSFPVIAKPLSEDASIGISESSVVEDVRALRDRVRYLFDIYRQDVLIEEYVQGRELNVSILGDAVLPIGEVIFDGLPDDLPDIVTYEAKWAPSSVYFRHTVPVCPAELDERTANEIARIALSAYRALHCRDYARIDMRLSTDGDPFVIEVNPNPDISTDSGFVRAAKAGGICHDELLRRIAALALDRSMDDGHRSVITEPVS